MSSVPSPRDLLTSIFTTLSSTPVDAATTNPLSHIPASHRALLTTLHVLYPSTLLPALDLLDRRLVTRVVVAASSAYPPGGGEGGKEAEPAAAGPPAQAAAEEAQPGPQTRSFHLVRSAQQQTRRHGQASSTDGRVYVVRLDAWNCSCAAFAFSAFPQSSSSWLSSAAARKLRGDQQAPQDQDPSHRTVATSSGYEIAAAGSMMSAGEAVEPAKEDGDRSPWSFGGLSVDGEDGSGIDGVPCCKHLLACVLGERWADVLGSYVEERVIGREEAAGLVADV